MPLVREVTFNLLRRLGLTTVVGNKPPELNGSLTMVMPVIAAVQDARSV